MTFDEIYDAVLETGLPVAVNFFEKDIPTPPYIVITYPQNNDMYGDNSNYAEITQIDIALYAKRRCNSSSAVNQQICASRDNSRADNEEQNIPDH